MHLTSPFLTKYIEAVPEGTARTNWQYESLEGAFKTIRNLGGMPCIAHPYTSWSRGLSGTFCVEIYTAFHGRVPSEFVKNWDNGLQYNQKIWGIAVNDHFGPQQRGLLPEEIIDSGKILVMSKQATLGAYRNAFYRGAFFAIADHGAIKDRYPEVFSIQVTPSSIIIESSGAVTWKAHGRVVGEGPTQALSTQPPTARYVRAEIRNANAVVYSQPFTLRPQGDVNGDFVTDETDAEMCLMLGGSAPPDALNVC